MTTPILQARDLHKSFGPTPALRGVDMDVWPGEVVAIMGPSGSGKSTLLHCLAGVLTPDRGSMTFRGQIINRLPEAARCQLRLRDFGFVFQFGQLLPDLTARDNVAIPLLLGGAGRATANTAALGWLARLGCAELADKLPAELSGGQAQRVAIARALVTEPALLFADEPTGSLDSLAAEQVMNELLGVVRTLGTTVLLITHDPRTAAYADREVMIRDGKVSAPLAAGSNAA